MIPESKVHLHDFEVVSNDCVAQDIYRLVMSAPDLAATLEPGQFMNLAVPGDPSHIVRIPLSFAQADGEAGTIELVYAVVGEGTKRLAQMEPGARSTVVGPSGNGWQLEGLSGRALVVSGGIGIAPALAAVRALVAQGVEADIVIGAQTGARVYGIDEAKALGASDVVVSTDDGSLGEKGFTTDAMRRLVTERHYDVVMTCGPQVMMKGVAALAREHEVSCQVSMERMMTCGFGACSTCNVGMKAGGYKSCCMDGPVFDAEEVAW